MERHVYEAMRRVEQDHWWFVARREILAEEIARLSLPRQAQILEVGCGTGGNLAMLEQFGAVCAIEPDADARRHAAAGSQADVREGTLPGDLPDFGRTFDLVAALDVIEHVDDDAGAIRAMAEALGPNAALLVTVPAHAWLWSDHDVQHHHKRRYSRASVRKLVEAAGLEVVRATYFNSILFPPIVAIRLGRAASRLKGGNDEALPPVGLNRMLKATFASERKLLRMSNLPIGLSILVVARRLH